MVKVKKKKSESIRKLIKRFQWKVSKENIVEEAKDAARFEKPSEKRKKKKYRLERLFERKRSNND